MTSKTVTVIRKPNGDTAFTIPVEGIENVHVVTLQKDGEIRWASVGPMPPEQASLFYDALRLALSFTVTTHNNIAGGVTYQRAEVEDYNFIKATYPTLEAFIADLKTVKCYACGATRDSTDVLNSKGDLIGSYKVSDSGVVQYRSL